MSGDESGSEYDRNDAPAPKIPTFFQPSDLPEWLRVPPPAAPVPRHESTRARQAWATAETAAAPEETDEFQTAGATALTQLVPAGPVRPARKRRGLFGIGAALPLLVYAA